MFSFQTLLLLFALLASAHAATERQARSTFQLCCLRMGIPVNISLQLCSYDELEYRFEKGRGMKYMCDMAERWEYTPQLIACMTNGEDVRDCSYKDMEVNPPPAEVPEFCVETFASGEPFKMSDLIQNAKAFTTCYNGWAGMMKCGKEVAMASPRGVDIFTTRRHTEPIPHVCELDRDVRNLKNFFKALCNKTLRKFGVAPYQRDPPCPGDT